MVQNLASELNSFQAVGRLAGVAVSAAERPIVCVQGLGFVGSAMATAVADARGEDGEACFNVVGIDLATADGTAKVRALNDGRFPIATTDTRLRAALDGARRRGNLVATTDDRAYALASVVVVDVPLDIAQNGGRPSVRFEAFRAALRTLGRRMRPGALVVIETTVPPGTTELIALPELDTALAERGLPAGSILLAHAYERVMPGDLYLDSIVNFWRAYAGHTEEAADACEAFLSQIINVEEYPLTRFHSTTASETAKVLENSYRATTIALMEEWGRFAEAVGVDLFEVVGAIRRRPTHSNMRQPGFGVGGYCLTKDPLFGDVAARELFGLSGLDFPFSTLAVHVNNAMPLVSVDRLTDLLGGAVAGRSVLLLGVSYRPDVGDTRQSPSQVFVEEAAARGATVICQDPIVETWPETGIEVRPDLPSPEGFDALVFAVPHREYRAIDVPAWLGDARPAVLDANDVLTSQQRAAFAALGCRSASIGRGNPW